MTTLKLLTIMNYRRRIIGFLHVIVYLLDIFDFGVWTRPNPWPTQDGEFCDPTQPDPTRPMDGPDPCPTLVYLFLKCIRFTVIQPQTKMSHKCPTIAQVGEGGFPCCAILETCTISIHPRKLWIRPNRPRTPLSQSPTVPAYHDISNGEAARYTIAQASPRSHEAV